MLTKLEIMSCRFILDTSKDETSTVYRIETGPTNQRRNDSAPNARDSKRNRVSACYHKDCFVA